MQVKRSQNPVEVAVQPLWPIIFRLGRNPDGVEHNKVAVELAYEAKQAGKTWGVAEVAKHNLYESEPNFLDDPRLEGLATYLGTLCGAILESDVDIKESWVHVTNGGGWHDTHCHPLFVHGICGIYYVQSAQCDLETLNGVNRFHSPNPFEPHSIADIAPQDGLVVLFPGTIMHSATPYTGKDDRIVIGFNVSKCP